MLQFIGSHPMCGSEKSGHENAEEGLYNEKAVYICQPKNSSSNAQNVIRQFWQKIGSRVTLIEPKLHDTLVTNTSHTLHIIAAIIVNNAKKSVSMMNLPHMALQAACAGGFKDTTRIASSCPQMWTEIIKQNKEEVSKSLTNFIEELQNVQKMIDNDNTLLDFFTKAKDTRDNLNFD